MTANRPKLRRSSNLLGQDGPRGYAMLARLAEADALATKDPAAAIKAYDALAGDPALDAVYQDIARDYAPPICGLTAKIRSNSRRVTRPLAAPDRL